MKEGKYVGVLRFLLPVISHFGSRARRDRRFVSTLMPFKLQMTVGFDLLRSIVFSSLDFGDVAELPARWRCSRLRCDPAWACPAITGCHLCLGALSVCSVTQASAVAGVALH